MDYIGIDYGRKRIGLSWGSDALQVVVPLKAITQFRSLDEALSVLQQRLAEYPCDALVIGWPLHMDGQEGKRTQEVMDFIQALKEQIHKPVLIQDERLSTQAAKDRSPSGNHSRRQLRKEKTSGALDSRAASVILEDYLEQSN